MAKITAMTPCPGCSRHVRDGELACPFCGGPVAPPRSRANIVGRVTRAAVFSAALVACGGKKDEAKPAPHGSAEHLDQDFNQLLGSAEGSAPAGSAEGSAPVAPAAPADAAVAGDAPLAIDAGLSDEERTRELQRAQEEQQRRRQHEQQQKQIQIQRQDWHNVAKPYGAPPARRRVV
jgi:hypothetical protein